MKRPFVKVCGITRLEDAERAIELGADAIGFVFWPRSPRVMTADAAAAIARSLPVRVVRAGVFVDMPPGVVAEAVSAVGLDVVQLHGDEQLDAFMTIPRASHRGARDGAQHVSVWKSVSVEEDRGVERASALDPRVVTLVDATDRERRGGTGRTADWNRAAALAARRPIVLAGGLTASNVEGAVTTVRPWGVDVSSGVEDAPGIKSAQRLREFFAALTGARTEDQ